MNKITTESPIDTGEIIRVTGSYDYNGWFISKSSDSDTCFSIKKIGFFKSFYYESSYLTALVVASVVSDIKYLYEINYNR